MTEAQKPAHSRLLRWVAAVGFGVPIALIAFAASPLGPNFFYVLVGIPALLFLWVSRVWAP
jgi:fatty acid desaturase